jgi:5-methylcytosine-specific restriction endonuclease McrA
MSRERHVPWVGKNDRAMPTPNVTLRIFARAKGCCQDCRRKLMAGERWHRDHIVPLEDGGANAEGNFQILCEACHGKKTGAEATERAKVRAKTKAAYGIRGPKQKIASRGFPKREKPAKAPKLQLASRRVLYTVGASDGD